MNTYINKSIKNTTLGYIEYDEKYLMLLRDVEKSDGSMGKWLGVGGKFEKDETADECFIREAFEETGIALTKEQLTLSGIVDFKSDKYGIERMYLYTASVASDYFNPDCNEGKLKWIDKKDILSLNMWEGDHIFLERLLSDKPYFELSLIYGGSSGDELLEVIDDELILK